MGDGAAENNSRQKGRSEKSNSVLRHGRSVVEQDDSSQRRVGYGDSCGRIALAAAAHANVSAFASSVGTRSSDGAP